MGHNTAKKNIIKDTQKMLLFFLKKIKNDNTLNEVYLF